MHRIKKLFQRKKETPNKKNINRITKILKNGIPMDIDVSNSSFRECENFNDCLIATTQSNNQKIIMPQKKEDFKDFITGNSDELISTMNNMPENIYDKERIEVVTEIIQNNAKHDTTPTRIMSALRKMAGYKETQVTGLSSESENINPKRLFQKTAQRS